MIDEPCPEPGRRATAARRVARRIARRGQPGGERRAARAVHRMAVRP